MQADRILAVDWSGARDGAERKIWLCEVAGGEVRRLENGRTREQIADHLIDEAARDPRFVAGLDFAFSFPHRFLAKRAHRSIDSVWSEAARLGEKWLAHCPFPFWGKPGRKKPPLGDPLLRRTERAIAARGGPAPKSVFQIGGAGTVGVGSIRGMPILRRLRSEGFAIWPFDPPRAPTVIEIWPRLFTGPILKSRAEERVRWMRERHPDVGRTHLRAVRESDDAFDALASALEMDRRGDQLARLEPTADRVSRLEGAIWTPAD